jgi:hypothetical protein
MSIQQIELVEQECYITVPSQGTVYWIRPFINAEGHKTFRLSAKLVSDDRFNFIGEFDLQAISNQFNE